MQESYAGSMGALLSILLSGTVAAAFVGGWVLGRARLLRARRAFPQVAAPRRSLEQLRVQVTHADSFLVEAQRRTAAHEAGHVIAAWGSPWTRVTEATIEPRGRVEGRITTHVVAFASTTRAWDDLVLDLGGLAGEVALHGKARSGGAAADLRSAVAIARALVAEGAVVPPWGDATSHASLDIGAMFAEPVPEAVAQVLTRGYRRARYLIGQNPDHFAGVVMALLVCRTLDADALAILRAGGRVNAEG